MCSFSARVVGTRLVQDSATAGRVHCPCAECRSVRYFSAVGLKSCYRLLLLCETHTKQAAACLQVKAIVQWKNPALSALVLLLGSFCALAGEFILRGNHSVTPLKGKHALSHCVRTLLAPEDV